MKKILLSILLAGFYCSLFHQKSFAQSTLVEKVEATTNPLVIPYEKWKLPNGLILIIHEDHSDPIVNVTVNYHVGSARESLGKSGFAHFFEHMMFEGSDHVKDKEHFKIVSEAGGNMNGFTQRDKTTYFETVPSNYLETALWLEADRMGFLLDSVTKQKFEIQRATVKNEKGQNVENQPYAMAFVETLNQALYPANHPYSWPVIGYVDDLNRVTVEDLKNFFLRWYGPNNAVLAISGDVNPKEALALTEKYFGPINACPEVKKGKINVPVLAVDQYANYVDNIYLPLTLMVYPTVQAYHRDEAALDVLASMMGEGNNSIFYKNFVKTEKAIGAGTNHGTNELTGEFQIQVFAYPDFETGDLGKSFNETEKKIHETIDEFEKTGITDEAVQRVKAKIGSEIVDQATTVFGKSLMLADWQTFLGRQYNLSDDYDRYDKVTKDDVTRVFIKYIKDKHAAIVNVYPKNPFEADSVTVKSVNPNANIKLADDPQYTGLKYDKAKDSFDRGKKPAAGSPKTIAVPKYYTGQLKNGLKIIGTQSSESPKVVLLLTIEGGNLVFAADPKKVGLAELTSAVMNEGTKNYTTEQISAELDKLGSDITFQGENENTTIVINSLAKNLDATLKLLEEKLLRPRFDEADFKRVKKQYIESISHERKVAEATADKLYNNLIYGNTIFGTYVTEKNVKKFTLDDVKNYYSQYYSPSAANIVIVGDIAENDMLKKLDFLNQWNGKEVKMPERAEFVPIAQTQIYLAHKEGAAQSVLMIGNPGLPYDATGDYYKSNVMNFSFGGSFNSRLNLNLREDKGYTYGIRSTFTGTKYPGTFIISASVKKNATDSCLTEIMKEVTNFRNAGLKDEEVTFTKNSYLNSDALKYEAPFQKAGFLSRIVRYNLPGDFTSQQNKILNDLSKNELNDLAKKYISPDKFVVLVVGNKYSIKSKIEKLGLGKVKEIELE
ncbi:MAG TPA: pitrilysin family protein [Bacteroidia bacterium]|nr:pitrilysin family protein [Bacteroidia bacterium]